MLIDVWRQVGLEGMAQVDLEVHRNRHQPLQELTPMAYTVLATIARRLEREGRLRGVESTMVNRPAALASNEAIVAGRAEAQASAEGDDMGQFERSPMASVSVR